MKKLIIASLIMLGLGIVVCGSVMAVKGPEILKEDNNLTASSFEVDEEFSSISVSAETNDVYFEQSSDGSCRVECMDEEGVTHDVTVEDDTLIITTTGKSNRFSFQFGISESPKIVVYLPENKYENLTVNLDSGDLELDGFDFTGDINVDITTGDSDFVNVTCANLLYNGTTGDIDLSNVIVSRNIAIDLTTGDVTFDRIDAFDIDVEITTGDVEGSILTAKTFACDTVNGDVSVPQSGNGGNCRINTMTGDISIVIAD